MTGDLKQRTKCGSATTGTAGFEAAPGLWFTRRAKRKAEEARIEFQNAALISNLVLRKLRSLIFVPSLTSAHPLEQSLYYYGGKSRLLNARRICIDCRPGSGHEFVGNPSLQEGAHRSELVVEMAVQLLVDHLPIKFPVWSLNEAINRNRHHQNNPSHRDSLEENAGNRPSVIGRPPLPTEQTWAVPAQPWHHWPPDH